ncbi:MAG: hypothetical protein UW43_C0008G0019 [Candidatus Yanofskybacteria bacterium GW2011_GWA1_44_21]|uniref:Bacterial type II secretion system protein E domain-containing protein n=2 Tax=Parcubacteria group TaxID=1794811 RepID=A0A0G0XL50_9BACT|nr:MAG: hypothetical protein UU85_C0006G0015 [Candidatus Wolfebacteria bacterium GW2011_GWA2_42_10]KKT50329.1 MAG: hypothetical protein UW43_C0008G0019 [Candidatus Yanofskybacteria bacterium GW2011_GWA1_44_21]KKT90168.1 MAG: hypothetical protein UW90_C0005G0023 [Candidatus Yanofskybacteria bacterium GW2011_GWB1_45_11]
MGYRGGVDPLQNQNELDKKLADIQMNRADEDQQALASKLGLPFSDLKGKPIDTEALAIVEENIARAGGLAVIYKQGSNTTLALLDPDKEEAKQVLAGLKTKGYAISIIITTQRGIERAWVRYKDVIKKEVFEIGAIKVSEEEIANFQNQIKSISDLKNKVAGLSVTKLLEILLAGALKIGASDIHFEPQGQKTRLRYRLDGVLNDVADIPSEEYKKIVSRVKVLSKLKINVSDSPQDGRFTIHLSNVDIEIRVSVLPSEYGETIVMRLLDPRTIRQQLEDLGMRPDLLEIVKEQLKKSTGAILTTGPTGSGKTTSLYAFIQYVNSPDVKVITIEDPIEYHISSISQTQVEPEKGYSFATGLRAIVRQDPDIILVGEIRDAETAEIALNAALTGHLVLSTLHTNNAAGTIPRLIDLGIQAQTIAPAITMAMAQRLVRKLCPSCKKESILSLEIMKKIEAHLSGIAKRYGIDLRNIKIFEAGKCDKCNQTGYLGRIGVYEAFLITPDMQKLILSSPSIPEIEAAAVEQGMVSMLQDGYLKMIEGLTTMEEIERVLS